ncbi:MAG: PKD domain-containing protein, partial [Phycisphaerae bacterium]|nr:PKD domain-containing protein [Phycisphaerae bacterium]
FTNYTSYWRGINGIMVDIAALPGVPTAADFTFKVGNDNNPAGWSAAPAPSSITIRSDAGAGGADRITIIWADNAIQKQWLQVTVLATGNTGLSTPDVFYFGNAIGETGNSPSDAEVTPADEVAVRNNPHTLMVNPTDITNTCDFNRDRKVGPTDAIIVRDNATNSMTTLKLIVPIVNQAPTTDAGPDDSITWPTNEVALDGTVSDDGLPNPPASVTTTWTKISGPGAVIFANSSAVDTTATFLAAGPYVLQLEASDGELSATDTVEIDVIDPTGLFFDDDFDDNNLNGWTTLAGSFTTFQYPSAPGYEVHATIADSRMRADLTDTNLSDIVYISCEIRHTGGTSGSTSGMGWKPGRLWLVDDTGAGFGLYFALDQTGNGALYICTTTDFGATEASAGDFSTPGNANGNDKKTVELVYNRLTDQVECFFEGVSKGTLSVSSSYRDFTKLVVYLKHVYDGTWGQLDIDDIRIANTSVGN